MKIPPELGKSIQTQLSRMLDNPESEHFLDLGSAVSLIDQELPPWEALASIGIHAAEIFTNQEIENKTELLQELINQTFEPIDKLFRCIFSDNLKSSFDSERTRLLFYTRFALGFLLLAKADENRSKQILHDMVSTKVTFRGHSYSGEAPGVLSYTSDISAVKLQSFFYLLPVYGLQKDWAEILFLITESIACAPWAKSILTIVPTILDAWVKENSDLNYDGPGLEWLWIFVEVSELLSLYDECDSTNSAPEKCNVASAQYLAWKIGQITGRFALRWPQNPFNEFKNFQSALEEKEFQSERGEESTHQTLMAILDLLRDWSPNRDWNKMREECLSMWRLSYSFSGMHFSDIGPCHDLFWAMKIGFADAFIVSNTHIIENGNRSIDSKLWSEIEQIMTQSTKEAYHMSQENMLQLVGKEESATLEFKASIRWDLKDKKPNDSLCFPAIKTVAAFLNSYGGKLIIGVGNNHEIHGLENDYKTFQGRRDSFEQYLLNKLCTHIGQAICGLHIKIKYYEIDQKEICLVDVDPCSEPIFITDNEDFYIRVGNGNRKLKNRELTKYVEEHFHRRPGQPKS